MIFKYKVNNSNYFNFKVQEGNENVLGELTFRTNQELFETKKFVSDGYIDKYTIKNGDPFKFKFEENKNRITIKTLMNIFKYLRNRKLNIFYLKIDQI